MTASVQMFSYDTTDLGRVQTILTQALDYFAEGFSAEHRAMLAHHIHSMTQYVPRDDVDAFPKFLAMVASSDDDRPPLPPARHDQPLGQLYEYITRASEYVQSAHERQAERDRRIQHEAVIAKEEEAKHQDLARLEDMLDML